MPDPLAPSDPPIPAIPTVVDGLRFRSRLEARWWSFMRSLGWQVEYEPLDLPGYVPDFVVRRARASLPGPVVVECKPYSSLRDGQLDAWRSKIDGAWHGPALLVGLHPLRDHEPEVPGDLPVCDPGAICLGWYRDAVPDAAGTWWHPACLRPEPGLTGARPRWVISPDPGALAPEPAYEVVMRWHDACNRAQWRPPLVAPTRGCP